MKRGNRGITLIALVITIIVLAILAGVSITTIIGNNGIIARALQASEQTKISQYQEKIEMIRLEVKLENVEEAVTLDKLREAFNSERQKDWVNTTEIITDDSISKIKLMTVDGYVFYITEDIIEYKQKETMIDTKDFIKYDANGGINTPQSQTKLNNTITSQKPTRDNYIFIGWGTSANAKEAKYKAGDKYTGDVAITLYALWYERIEYLENNGYQYIDTNVKPNQDTSIEVKAQTLDTNVPISGWYGARKNQSNELAFVLWNINGKFRADYNNEQNTIESMPINTDTVYTVYQNKNTTKINEQEVATATYSVFQSPVSLTLYGTKIEEQSEVNGKDAVDCRTSKLRLYSCKLWDKEELIREYIPVKDFEGIACLFDCKNDTLYYLQDNFEQLSYIESSGTQKIDTKYYPNQDTSIEFVAQTTETNTISSWFGGRNQAKGNSDDKSFSLWNMNGQFRTDYGAEVKSIDGISIDTDTIYTIYKNKNITKINDMQVADLTYSTFQSPSSLTLFGVKTYTASDYNSANTVDYRMAKLKLYSCKIWQNEILVMDFIPVRNNTNTICLFDKVNRLMYYNQGSGVFLAEN